MVHLADLPTNDDHPVALELSSLKVAVARFQDEAHTSSLKLQRHSLETARVHERAAQLERENTLLKKELNILRANPHPDASPQSHPAVLQVQQLTLSLRHLSDKITLSEEALHSQIAQIAHAEAEADKAKSAKDAAYELAVRIRAREEAGLARERELEQRARAAEEEVKLSNVALQEYADLVRSLEGRAGIRSMDSGTLGANGSVVKSMESSGSYNTMTIADRIARSKLELKESLLAYQTDKKQLRAEYDRIRNVIEDSNSKNQAESKSIERDLKTLARAQFELQKLQLDDNAAAKMVSRYMKFSQKSTDSLQLALEALKKRHSATVDTLTSNVMDLSSQLQSSEATTERLRSALDELGGELMKETVGRRKEVALKIKIINREEKLQEALRRWIRRSEEAIGRIDEGQPGYDAILTMAQDARILLASLDGPMTDTFSLSGSLGRQIAMQHGIDSLIEELQAETARRLELERVILQNLTAGVETHSTASIATGDDRQTNSERDNLSEISASRMSVEVFPAAQSPLPSDTTMDYCSIQESPNPTLPTTNQKMHTNYSQYGELFAPDANPIVILENHLEEQPTTVQNIPVSIEVHQELSSTPMTVESLTELDIPKTPSIISIPVDTHPQLSPLSTHPNLDFEPQTPIEVEDQLERSKDLEALTTPDDDTESASILVHNPNQQSSTDDKAFISIEPSEEIPLHHSIPGEDQPSLPVLPMSPHIPPKTLLSTHPSIETDIDNDGSGSNTHINGYLVDVQPSHEKQPMSSTLALQTFSQFHSLTPQSETEGNNDLEQQHVPHPLLVQLAQISTRYDSLQRAFRDCYMAIDALKQSLLSASGTANSSGIPDDILRVALDRLLDYVEDARVELDIRISDEALLARGYETLLSVPGALRSPSDSDCQRKSAYDAHESMPTRSEIELQIEEFISGTELSIQKARETLSRKLDDVQHDISALKLAMHDLAPTIISPSTLSPIKVGGTSTWTSWMRSPSGSTTPIPDLGPSPTFGNIMTSPRLRHSSSLNFNKKKYIGENNDPLTALGLRVPMPSFQVRQPPPPLQAAAPRSRTVSTMYMLGLGARTPSGSFPGIRPSPSPRISSMPRELSNSARNEHEVVLEADDIDVE